MGPLAGLKYKEIVRRLKKAGFEFDRNAKGSHEIWWNYVTRAGKNHHPEPPRRHARGTLRAILKQAGITIEEFLRL